MVFNVSAPAAAEHSERSGARADQMQRSAFN